MKCCFDKPAKLTEQASVGGVCYQFNNVTNSHIATLNLFKDELKGWLNDDMIKGAYIVGGVLVGALLFGFLFAVFLLMSARKNIKVMQSSVASLLAMLTLKARSQNLLPKVQTRKVMGLALGFG